MGGTFVKIFMFFFILNVMLIAFHVGGDYSIVEGNVTSNNSSTLVTGFGFTVNETSGEITPPTADTLVHNGYFVAILGAAALVLAASVILRDPSFAYRAGIVIALLSLVGFPFYTVMTIPALPLIVKTIVIIPITMMAIWAIVDFISGTDL